MIWPTIGEIEAWNDHSASRQSGTLPDLDVIRLITDRIGPEAAQRARALARELIREMHASGELDLVAAALLSRSTLTGADLDQLLNRRKDDQ